MKRLIKALFVSMTLALSACTPTQKTDETVKRTIRIGTEQFTASLDSALEWKSNHGSYRTQKTLILRHGS